MKITYINWLILVLLFIWFHSKYEFMDKNVEVLKLPNECLYTLHLPLLNENPKRLTFIFIVKIISLLISLMYCTGKVVLIKP